jgi:hypothetical protein
MEEKEFAVTIGNNDSREFLFNKDGHQIMTRKEAQETISEIKNDVEPNEKDTFKVYKLTEVE